MGPPLIVLTLIKGWQSYSTFDPRAKDALPVLILMGDKTRETASAERLSHRVKKMRGLSAAHSITNSWLLSQQAQLSNHQQLFLL